MKKNITWLLVCVFAVSMLFIGAGCKEEAAPVEEEVVAEEEAEEVAPAEEEAEETVEEKEFTVGYINLGMGIPYPKALAGFVEEEFSKYPNVKLIALDSQLDAQLQANQMDDFIVQKVDAILIMPLDAKAIVPSVKKAYEAGIPVIISQTLVDNSGWGYVLAYIGPSDEIEGELAAEVMIEGMKKNIGEDLSDAKVVILEGHPGIYAQIYRSLGFENKLAELAPEVTILEKYPVIGWDKATAVSVMENFLIKYPQIDGVYGEDDGLAVGAIEAIKSANRMVGKYNPVVVGVNGSGEALDSIIAGEMFATVAQPPSINGRTCVEITMKILNNEPYEFWNVTEMPVVTSENVEGFPVEF